MMKISSFWITYQLPTTHGDFTRSKQMTSGTERISENCIFPLESSTSSQPVSRGSFVCRTVMHPFSFLCQNTKSGPVAVIQLRAERGRQLTRCGTEDCRRHRHHYAWMGGKYGKRSAATASSQQRCWDDTRVKLRKCNHISHYSVSLRHRKVGWLGSSPWFIGFAVRYDGGEIVLQDDDKRTFNQTPPSWKKILSNLTF